MDQAENIRTGPDAALAPVYRKIDRLNDTMAAINDIAADANRSIKHGRFHELSRHQSRVSELARSLAQSDRRDADARSA